MRGVSPIVDPELSFFLAEKKLNLRASRDLQASVSNADYVIVVIPTNYDEEFCSRYYKAPKRKEN